jgi:hypothetical protein
MAYVKFWADLEENMPSSKDSNTLYFVTDTGQLYKGDDLIADKTPENLPNKFGFNLYANGETTPLHTYDGSSTVNLKAGAFVQFTESPDGTITISSADNNTTYTLSGAASGNTWVTTLTPSSGDPTTSTVPAMKAASSSAAGGAGLVPAPAKGKQSSFLKGDGTWATPADTKVTSAANHYAPAEDEAAVLNASSTTAATWGSTDLITGLKRDAKGHIVGVTSIQMPANPNTVGTNVIGAQNATSNSAQSTNGNVYLTHVDGDTAKSSHQIKGSGKVTVTSDANGNITIAGAQTTLADLGLGNAIHFLGISSSAITNGGTQKPTIDTKEVTPKAGDVVFYNNQEFIYVSNKWELFGDEGSYVLKTKKIKAGTGIAINNNLTESTLEEDITIKNTGVTSIGSGLTNGTIAVFLGGSETPQQVSVTGFEALIEALTWQSGTLV